MAGYYDITSNDATRKVRATKIADPRGAAGVAVWLEDAAEDALTGALTAMPFANLVTWPGAVVSATAYEIAYNQSAGPLYIVSGCLTLHKTKLDALHQPGYFYRRPVS